MNIKQHKTISTLGRVMVVQSTYKCPQVGSWWYKHQTRWEHRNQVDNVMRHEHLSTFVTVLWAMKTLRKNFTTFIHLSPVSFISIMRYRHFSVYKLLPLDSSVQSYSLSVWVQVQYVGMLFNKFIFYRVLHNFCNARE